MLSENLWNFLKKVKKICFPKKGKENLSENFVGKILENVWNFLKKM